MVVEENRPDPANDTSACHKNAKKTHGHKTNLHRNNTVDTDVHPKINTDPPRFDARSHPPREELITRLKADDSLLVKPNLGLDTLNSSALSGRTTNGSAEDLASPK